MRRSPGFMLAIVILAACSGVQPGAAPESFEVPSLGIRVPKLDGWVSEETRPEEGGPALRIVPRHAITGSPRIEVVAEPRSDHASHIEEFLTRNLREMAALEESGKIRITTVDQRPVSVGPRRGYRVRHEYILSGGQIAITQISTFLVLDGRGIAVTAVGRTELFAPLAQSIEKILSGLSTTVPTQQRPAIAEPTTTPAPQAPSSLTQPVDLGTIGGNAGKPRR